jgi:hypothetical protein
MVNLFLNYYIDKNELRNKELELCIYNNINNKNINTIIIESSSRLKYSDFFSYMKKVKVFNDINIIANLDIYFDESIILCESINNKDVYALSRWDDLGGRLVHFDRKDSQDAWIFRGVPENVFGDFYLGVPGCDNKIAFEFKSAGYSVYNPSLDIRAIHVHRSRSRNYSTKDRVLPPYLVVPSCKLSRCL